jgi:hypothetical protein
MPNELIKKNEIVTSKSVKNDLILYELSEPMCFYFIRGRYKYYLANQDKLIQQFGTSYMQLDKRKVKTVDTDMTLGNIISFVYATDIKKFMPTIKNVYLGKYILLKYKEYDMKHKVYVKRHRFMRYRDFLRMAKVKIDRIQDNKPTKLYKDLDGVENRLYLKMHFIKESYIAYLSHVHGRENKYVKVLIELNQRSSGEDFDTYIQRWAKRLLYGKEG